LLEELIIAKAVGPVVCPGQAGAKVLILMIKEKNLKKKRNAIRKKVK
jgi:hypothetical protein